MKVNQIKIYEHEKFGQVRTVLIDGIPWFVGKDVISALSYSNARDAVRKHVDIKDKGVAKWYCWQTKNLKMEIRLIFIRRIKWKYIKKNNNW